MQFLKIRLTVFFFLACAAALLAQSAISRVEPANWWVGMKNPNVQLLVYGKNIAALQPSVQYAGVKITRVDKVPNPNYLFVTLNIGKKAKPGKLELRFSNKSQTLSHTWELWAREPNSAQRQGFDQTDVLYLITPDRFANGDPANDAVAGMREKPNRALPGGRHGGDLAGIRQHLDYIADLGFTAVWLNPVLENDMPDYSYHGYAATDFYKVDARFGTNEEYRALVQTCKARGIKSIMDMIVNHCGLEHWWMKDLPAPDWINQWPQYTETNHRKTLRQDPHAAEIDKKIFEDGWFVPTMPDLNQRNPFLATYLTQNSIWWVEYAGLAGIRMDTYPYPDEDYMTEWSRAIMAEYPNFNIVGEEWYENPAIVSFWQRGKINPNGYTSDMKSLMDFPVQATLTRALNGKETWGTGWINLYELIGMDFLYPDPSELVTFPDNHDMSRFYTQVNEDFDLFKLGLAYILTGRGIPQLYYGTEVLMTNPGTTDHGIIRSDFPGGWAGDKANAFTGAGLTDQQKAAKTFVQKLLQWRKNAPAVQSGKLTHFIPKDGVYVYFRHNDQQKVMVVLNKNAQPYTLQLDYFTEMLQGAKTASDVLGGGTQPLGKTLTVPAKAPMVLEIK